MVDEQAQNGAPDAPQATTSDAPNGAVKDTALATPQIAPNEPLPSTNTDQPTQAPTDASEPAQLVSGMAQPANATAQTAGNELVPKNDEPLDIPPFDNSPTPLPQSQTPAPASAPQARSGRDLLTKARSTIQERKSKKLEKILSLFATKEKITNDEVEKPLHVSDATATRYLSGLEKQGKIRQEGKIGHAVSYSRI